MKLRLAAAILIVPITVLAAACGGRPSNSTLPTEQPLGIPSVFGWDALAGQLLMSGLSTQQSSPIDWSTWTFRETGWAKAPADIALPGGIHPGFLVYDSDHKREIFINRGTYSTQVEVWVRDATTGWRRVETAHFTGGVIGQNASAAFSPQLHAVVVVDPGFVDGPTWLFDGTNWRSIQTVHTFESARQVVLGYDPTRKAVIALSLFDFRTWVFDGRDWLAHDVTGPIPEYRDNPAVGFDPEHGQWIFFGGGGNPLAYNDTWTGDGTSWTQRTSTPTPRARSWVMGGSFLAFDSAAHRFIMFGGQDGLAANAPFFGDTWAWQSGAWKQLAGPVYPPVPASGSRLQTPAG